MGQQALVDTTVLYAAGNRSEQTRHETGLSIVREADRGSLPNLVVSDVVLVETMNGLQRDVRPDLALDMLDRLQVGANFRLVREPQAVWDHGLELYQGYPGLSLADAILVGSARHRGIEYIYSFDTDFDGIEKLGRIAEAENPFAP